MLFLFTTILKDVLKPKYPTDFDGVSFQMQDEKSEYFTVTLSIEMTSLNEFKKDRYSNHIFYALKYNFYELQVD